MSGPRPLVVCACLAAAVFLTYAPVFRNGFIGYDDPDYVTANTHVTTGLTPENIGWAFTTSHASNWHPLTWLSHQADCTLFGVDPVAHHFTNLLLHIANTVLLFLFLNAATGSWWKSAFIAAIFGLHPLHVQSVAWAAERKDVLCTFFGMLALLAYLRRRYALMAVLFACALMAKPMLVTLPLLLLILDWWPLQRKLSIREKLPLAALTVLASIVTVWAQKRGGAVATLETLPFGLRLSNALVSYVAYLGKTLWPANLSVLYPFPLSGIPAWKVIASAALLIAITAVAVALRKQRPWLLAGWCWYLVSLAPVIGIVQVGMQSMADRYMYVPMIGLLLAAAWELPWQAMPVLAVACALVTWNQVQFWKDGVTLFEHAVAVTENNFIAHNSLGVELDQRNRPDEALAHYKEAVRIRPGDRASENNYSQALFEKGERLAKAEQLSEALPLFEEGLRHRPRNASALTYKGVLLAAFGRFPEALQALDSALSIDPDFAVAKTARAEVVKAMSAPQ